MHAVSQGALGIECRLNDLEIITMINRLNDENTLLRCIAERTFLARLEGGCSAPVGVVSKVTENSILLEGVVLDLCGQQRVYDKFEIQFSNARLNDCPMASKLPEPAKLNLKHKLDETEDEPDEFKKVKSNDELETTTNNNDETAKEEEKSIKHFSFIVDLNIDQSKMIKAELCGLHLAQKLKDKGADVLIRECKEQVLRSN